jgi:transposase-like protein
MAALSQSTRRKLWLLQLAQELGNVSKACRLMGYHRDTFYEARRAFQVGGVQALVEQRRGPRGPHPNRVSPEIEARILASAYPVYSERGFSGVIGGRPTTGPRESRVQ